ncbi:hypothetical protein SDC9_57353 [bioreactor metagenome]|uniref:Uncharacterized protein n=1 Tax=bioreactor metagenome TaxID=1076179 RepID=A0A644X4D3_9ZZZZ
MRVADNLVCRNNEHAVRRNVNLIDQLVLHVDEAGNLLLHEVVGRNRGRRRSGVDVERFNPHHLVFRRVEAEVHDILILEREVLDLFAVFCDDEHALRTVLGLPQNGKVLYAAFHLTDETRKRQRRFFADHLQLRFVEHNRHAFAAGHADVRSARAVGIVLFTVRQVVKMDLSVGLIQQAVAGVDIRRTRGNRRNLHFLGGFLLVKDELVDQRRRAENDESQHRE